MPHVDDNGVKLWYRVKGNGDRWFLVEASACCTISSIMSSIS